MTDYLRKRLRAFRYAFQGIFYMFRNEAHALIHLLATALVVTGGFLFRISSIEWCVVILCIGMVLSAEGFNTAIEKLADKVTTERHPLIGVAKDVAAGAVLISAIASVVIAAVIFIPKF